MVVVSQATFLMLVGGIDGHRGIGIRRPGSRICKECDIVDHARLIAGCGQRRCDISQLAGIVYSLEISRSCFLDVV